MRLVQGPSLSLACARGMTASAARSSAACHTSPVSLDCKLAALGRLTIESAMPASSPFSSSICPGRWRAGAPRSAVGRVFRFFARGKRALVGADVSSVLMKQKALGPRRAAAAERRLKRLSDRHGRSVLLCFQRFIEIDCKFYFRGTFRAPKWPWSAATTPEGRPDAGVDAGSSGQQPNASNYTPCSGT